MPFRYTVGACRNCGQRVSFFATILTDEFPVRVLAHCELCQTANLFGAWRNPLAWSDSVRLAPKDCVPALLLPDRDGLAPARARARRLVRQLLELIRSQDPTPISFDGADNEAETEARLVRQIARFIVDSDAGVDPEGLTLLTGQLECLLLQKSRHCTERWTAAMWQRFRDTLSAVAGRLNENAAYAPRLSRQDPRNMDSKSRDVPGTVERP